MGRDLAKVYGFGCLAFVVVLFGAGVMMSRSWARCPPEVDARIAAPADTPLEAVVFHYECGFGRKGSTSVSVVPPGQRPIYPGNLFVAMDSSGMNYLLGRGTPPRVEVVWESPTEITIRYQAGAQIMASNPTARGVGAKYEVMQE